MAQERGWRQAGREYRGTYKTAYGSFLGLIEEVRPGNYRLSGGKERIVWSLAEQIVRENIIAVIALIVAIIALIATLLKS